MFISLSRSSYTHHTYEACHVSVKVPVIWRRLESFVIASSHCRLRVCWVVVKERILKLP